MTHQPQPLADLQARATGALRAYRFADEDSRTAHLREVGELFVAVRRHITTVDGDPDWKGRTGAYRQWVRQAALNAGITPEELPTVLAAVRYHSGAALRRELNAASLAELGLLENAPRERAGQARSRASRTVALFAGEPDVVSAEDALLVLASFNGALHRVDPSEVRAAGEALRAELVDAATVAVHRARAIAQAAKMTK
jgi:hypothetical protein